MAYRQTTPQEIAISVRMIADAAKMADLDDRAQRRPIRLRKLLADIAIMAEANAKWLEAQKWGQS